MTAIYLVWNKEGFAFAGDSNVSIEVDGKTEWLQATEKIFSIPNHQIAVGSAGRGKINGLSIREIFGWWAENLGPKENFNYFGEYVANFVAWFSTQPWQLNYSAGQLGEGIETNAGWACFDILEKMVKAGVTWQVAAEQWIDEFSRIMKLNAAGPSFRDTKLITPERLDSGSMSQEITERLSKAYSERKAGAANLGVLARENIKKHISDSFEEDFDSTNEIHRDLLDQIADVYIERFPYVEEYAHTLMVGFGNDDPSPTAYSLRLYDNLSDVPRILIEEVSQPHDIWWWAIGVTASVTRLFRGYSRDLLEHSSFTATQKDKLESHLDEYSERRIESMRGKVSMLSVERMTYIARMFVELEALESYLQTPLPGVGGDISVVSMTKSRRFEKIFSEF